MRRVLVIAVVAWAATYTATSAPAATRSGCGAAVLKDWADGKLDHRYPIRCYQDALNRMPEDMRSYTTAPDDIQRALLAQLRTGRAHHGLFRGGAKQAPKHHARAAAPTTTPSNRRASSPTPQGPVREALAAASAEGSRATVIPLPLVILGAIGLLLLMGGSAGALGRRLRAHPARDSRP
jgi:hypothetical protein